MAKRKRQPAKGYDLDIVIPVYGQPDLLQKCLDSIEATKGDINANIIIVDDCGPQQDELGEVYKSLNGNARVSRNPQNSGFAKTVNYGIALGNAPLVLVLNTDIVLLDDSLQAMQAEFTDPAVGVCAPKLLFPNDSLDPHRPANKVQHAGLCIDLNGNVLHAGIGWDKENPAVNERKECQAVTGACMMIRRKTLEMVYDLYKKNNEPTNGALNEVYGKGTYEDVEFCFVARSVGQKVVYTPLAEAYHYVGASVTGAKEGYPLSRNEMIFKARCGAMMTWDEFEFL